MAELQCSLAKCHSNDTLKDHIFSIAHNYFRQDKQIDNLRKTSSTYAFDLKVSHSVNAGLKVEITDLKSEIIRLQAEVSAGLKPIELGVRLLGVDTVEKENLTKQLPSFQVDPPAPVIQPVQVDPPVIQPVQVFGPLMGGGGAILASIQPQCLATNLQLSIYVSKDGTAIKSGLNICTAELKCVSRTCGSAHGIPNGGKHRGKCLTYLAASPDSRVLVSPNLWGDLVQAGVIHFE